MKSPSTKSYTLGGLMAAPKLAKIPAPAALPKAAGKAGTLRLNRLPLSKVRTGPGY